MSESIPEWLGSIGGFDPLLWWRFIVCTGGKRHGQEVVGVCFEHKEFGETHWAPRTVNSSWLIWFTRMDEAQRSAAREKVDRSAQAFYGRGSMRVACPAGCEWRIPREKWGRFVDESRRVSPDWVDVSLLG